MKQPQSKYAPRYKRPSGTSVVEDDAPGILSRTEEEEAELAFGLLLQMSVGRGGLGRQGLQCAQQESHFFTQVIKIWS